MALEMILHVCYILDKRMSIRIALEVLNEKSPRLWLDDTNKVNLENKLRKC